MYQEFLARSSLLIWPMVGFFIFLVTFLAVLVSVLRKGRKRGSLDRLAALPLQEDAFPPAPAAREHASGRSGRPTTGGE